MTAVTIISAIVFIAITLSVVAIVYQTGMPLIEKMQQAAALERMSSGFSEIDALIQDVAREGNGSRRTLDLRVDMGRQLVDAQNDMLFWRLDTENMILVPRTADFFGNMIVGSNLGSSAYEEDYQGTPAYVLENDHLRVYVRKIGAPESHADFDTDNLLMGVYQKDLDQWLPIHSMEITINNDPLSVSGSGYTLLENTGEFLPYGRVNVYMDSGWGEYYLNMTLGTGADFIQVEAQT